jgi:glycosyltransferase involved in cell wall biosynthesis
LDQGSAALVVVVVLNYNGRHHLEYCLPSLLGGLNERYRLLVVDNASTDGSAEFVERNFPGVLLVRNPRNSGWSGGNNLGIRHALQLGARYVVLANNDIRVDSRWLDQAVAVADRDLRIGILGFNVFEAGGQLDNLGDFTTACRQWQQTQLMPAGYVGGMAMFIRAELFAAIGFIDEGYFVYGEENDFQIRAEQAGYRTVAINVPVWHFGQGFFGSAPRRAAMLQTRSNIRLRIKFGTVVGLMRSGWRHVFGRILGRGSRLPPTNAVEGRLRSSVNPWNNLKLLVYCAAWNLWHLPTTLKRRVIDGRRARCAAQRWASEAREGLQ